MITEFWNAAPLASMIVIGLIILSIFIVICSWIEHESEVNLYLIVPILCFLIIVLGVFTDAVPNYRVRQDLTVWGQVVSHPVHGDKQDLVTYRDYSGQYGGYRQCTAKKDVYGHWYVVKGSCTSQNEQSDREPAGINR